MGECRVGSWSSLGAWCRRSSMTSAGAGPQRWGSGGGWVELVPAAPDGRPEMVERVGQAWVGVAQRLLEGDLTESAFADHRRDGCHVVPLSRHEGLVDRS